MLKKLIVILFLTFFFSSASYSGSHKNNADKDTNNISKKTKKNNNFMIAFKKIKIADKNFSKGKKKKSQKLYNDAIEYLLKANKDLPLNEEILIFLGRSHDRINKKNEAEIYYNLALELNPNNNSLNKTLGIFYAQQKKFKKANKKLIVLKNCGCKEYNELKSYLENNS